MLINNLNIRKEIIIILFLIIIIFIIVIVAVRSHRDSEYYGAIGKQTRLKLARKKYAESIQPKGLDASYLELDLSSYDSRKLGAGSYINFMFSTIGTYHEPVILFPESNYGLNRKYFLLNVDFRPNYRAVENGQLSGQHGSLDYHYFTHNYGVHMSPQTYHSTTVRQEIPSSALLTFKPVDKEYTIIVVANNITQADVDFIKQHFELTDINREAIRRGQQYVAKITSSNPNYHPVSLPLLTGGTSEEVGNLLGAGQPLTYMLVNSKTKEVKFPSMFKNSIFYLCSRVFKEENNSYSAMIVVLCKTDPGVYPFMGIIGRDEIFAKDILKWSIPLNKLEDFIPHKYIPLAIKHYQYDWQEFLKQYNN